MGHRFKRSILTPFVILIVLLAGCGGGGGDGGGTQTPTATTEAPMTTTSPAGGGGTTTAGGGMETTTTTPSEPTTTTTSEPPSEFNPEEHVAALREAGSFTVEFTIEVTESNGSTVFTANGTQKNVVSTGEMYLIQQFSGGSGTTTIEYYRPPNSNTTYQHVAGQTSEVSGSQGGYNFTNPGTGNETGEWPDFREAGSGSTTLGPATKYVVDSVEDLPESVTDQYDSVKSVDFTIWVDDDTGVIAKYVYRLTYVDDGKEQTIEVRFKITDLGSTTIDKPDWAP